MNLDFGHWVLPTGITNIPENSLGFIYIIQNKSNNKKYIGKKLLFFRKSKKPLKNRKNKRHSKIESDWKEYTGSSNKLNDDIKKIGIDEFRFQIIQFYKTKLELSYHETKEIIDRNAIFSEEYYNEVLNCRFRNKKYESL